MKKLGIFFAVVVGLFVLLALNECTNPHWFNGGGCGGFISADTVIGKALGVKCD